MKHAYLVKSSQELTNVHKLVIKLFEQDAKDQNNKNLLKEGVTYTDRSGSGTFEVEYDFKLTAKRVKVTHKEGTDIFEVKYLEYTRLPVLSIDDLYVTNNVEMLKISDSLDEKLLANSIYLHGSRSLPYKAEKPNWALYKPGIPLSLKCVWVGVVSDIIDTQTVFTKMGLITVTTVRLVGSQLPMRFATKLPNIRVVGKIVVFNALTDDEGTFTHAQALSLEKLSTIINVEESDLQRLKAIQTDLLTCS